MCTRFVYHGQDVITGFNFDIDLSVWKHKVRIEKDRFYIGILRPDGIYHSYHGVNRNGNVGTLLYVQENPDGVYQAGENCITIAALTEQFIQGQLSFDDVLEIAKTKKITYAPDASMQALLSDAQGRVLILEPGIGYRQEQKRYSLITNYSLIKPESTEKFIVPDDDRYERALEFLSRCQSHFSISDAQDLLQVTCQEGKWATRVSFLYSVKEQAVYYTENNNFKEFKKFGFPLKEQKENHHATENLSTFK